MLQIGIKNRLTLVVEEKDTASYYCSGFLEVFSTPAMITNMEKCCLLSVKDYLGIGEDTVGTVVEVNHLRATPISAEVLIESELIEIEGRKLKFKVIASDNKGIIGEGFHTRFIIDVNKFLKKLS